jgi:hypothetical protein
MWRQDMRPKTLEPEWTPEQILKIRQIYRKGGTLDDVIKFTGSVLRPDAVRRRAINLGMRFVSAPRAHDGTSLMVKFEAEGNKHA